MAPVVDPWLIEAAMTRVKEFTAQLRLVDDGAAGVPGLDWSVSDLAQHVLSLPSFWDEQHRNGASFDMPHDFAAYADEARAHLTVADPAQLATEIEAAFERFLSGLSESDGQRWMYGVDTTATAMCGFTLNELVLHGRDLAAVTNTKPPTFERREANAAVDALLVTTPVFVDPTKAAAQPDGTYHVRFRGGNEYTWTKNGGQLMIDQGRPRRADARLNADPAMFLLASLNRVGQVKAALSGQMVAYGRRPWRFIGLGTIAIDGI